MKTETAIVRIKKDKKGLALLAFLSTLGFVEIEQPAENAFVAGKFKPGEKPSDFAGIWANDERTAESIREQAWARKN
ncbi:hypothetical protein [Rhodoflexus caldus]|uniref:hypothetical protein n=1 Tax=Rhodoflexus caldus TaxID=2891236 RepID=UPI00202A764F|nr:hypothetical protein [Rhodoflexus caldus]